MSLLRDYEHELRMKHIRAGVRVNSRVKVAVESTTRNLYSVGQTADISAYGCLAMVADQFEKGEVVLLKNLINRKACEAVVVWVGLQNSEGWELGVKLGKPTADFWELDF